MLIDLNADLGEGAGTDAEIMPLITSANVCCGLHAGGSGEISVALKLARRHNIVVGAHPGYPDREHFGRREWHLEEEQLLRMYVYQYHALWGLSELEGCLVRYVKPHGALYHQACREEDSASALLRAFRYMGYDANDMPVVGLPGSVLHHMANDEKVLFVPEGFADRRYRPDGSLIPRTEPDAIIHDPKEAVDQVEWLIGKQQVRTICVHGDTPGAVEFVKAVRGFLLDRGHELKAFA